MINSKEFAKRLEKILDHYDLSASSLADKLGIGRSSISHVISGRNKPSLDFTLKILQAFPDIDLYWLLNGKGKFPPTDSGFSKTRARENTQKSFDQKGTTTAKTNPPPLPSSKIKKIDKIIIFYKDGSFENYQNDS